MLSWMELSERSVIFTAWRHGSGLHACTTPITITYFPRRRKAHGDVHIETKTKTKQRLHPSELNFIRETNQRLKKKKNAESRYQHLTLASGLKIIKQIAASYRNAQNNHA